MKILLYGASGWIGQKIVKLLSQNGTEFTISDTRLDDTSKIRDELLALRPSHVICTIGRTHGFVDGIEIPTIDYLENKGKLYENARDNLYAPVSLALLCKEMGIHLTYLGTGCIFTYSKDKHVFTEMDEPNFFGSSYSVIKGFTDRFMHLLESSVLNIRIRMPIASDTSPRNLIMKLIKYKKICSIPNSMSVLDELLPVMIDMSMKGVTGTINLVNPGTIEHSEILDMYKEIIDPDFKYELFTYEDQMKVIASERSNNELDTKKISELGYKLTNIKESIRKIMTFMSRSL